MTLHKLHCTATINNNHSDTRVACKTITKQLLSHPWSKNCTNVSRTKLEEQRKNVVHENVNTLGHKINKFTHKIHINLLKCNHKQFKNSSK